MNGLPPVDTRGERMVEPSLHVTDSMLSTKDPERPLMLVMNVPLGHSRD